MSAGRRLFIAGLASVAVLSAIAVPASAVTPTIADLSPLPTGTFGGASAINDSGVIVGFTQVSNLNQAAKWTPDGKVTALTRLPNADSAAASAINSSGTIVGTSSNDDGEFFPTQWTPNGAVRALASPPGFRVCDPLAINDSGVIAGICAADADFRAVRWNPNGTVVVLPTPPGNRSSRAYDINAAGVIVGSLSPDNTGTKAVRWSPDGSVADLANLPDGVFSEARGINDSGQITGTIVVSPPGIVEHAVRWNTDGTVTTLPTPPNAPQKLGSGHEISPNGTVIGITKDAANRFVPAVWSPNGTLSILSGRTPDSETGANGINKRNVIVGFSGFRAVRWTGSAGIPCTVKPFCGS